MLYINTPTGMFYIKIIVGSSLIWSRFDSIYYGIPSVIYFETIELIKILYCNNRTSGPLSYEHPHRSI
jgi:hypothetical protein